MTLARALAFALTVLAVASTGAGALASRSASIFDYPRPLQQWGYSPKTIAVGPGEWVTWSNDGQDVHTVTALNGSFDSGELAPSEGFSWFFDEPGLFDYYCTLHDWMKAQVVVGDGRQPASVPASQPEPEPVPSEEPIETL